ncbi:MAG: extracellular solute-binding protein [Sedimentisphaerales bacterium]|nr:extracellular solute-binding protein [Sedimentisphaerales bacterium]
MTQENQNQTMTIPLHRRIAESLGEMVSSGKLKPGEKLPSERQIARQFEASRATVRTALSHLEQSGLINRRERRSAVVAIRRDVSPHLRIACNSPRLIQLFNRLSDLHILPPRCQLQQVDMQQPGTVDYLATQPVMGADVLICELEYLNYLRLPRPRYHPIRREILGDVQLTPLVEALCREDSGYCAVPLMLAPQVIYLNHHRLADEKVEMPPADWTWPDLLAMADRLTRPGYYGFQFRPTFAQLQTILVSRGGQFYGENGRLALDSEPFESTLRLIHDLIHRSKTTPMLARTDTINLFAESRCGMALDGADMWQTYQERLGAALRVLPVPGSRSRGTTLGVHMAVVLSQPGDSQPAEELVRTLLTTNSQRILAQLSGGLPARRDLLNPSFLESANLTAPIAGLFLQQVEQATSIRLPAEAAYRQAVEKILLELWLGLDQFDRLMERLRAL